MKIRIEKKNQQQIRWTNNSHRSLAWRDEIPLLAFKYMYQNKTHFSTNTNIMMLASTFRYVYRQCEQKNLQYSVFFFFLVAERYNAETDITMYTSLKKWHWNSYFHTPVHFYFSLVKALWFPRALSRKKNSD